VIVRALQNLMSRGRLWQALTILAICLLGGALVGAFVATLTPLWAAALVVAAAGGLLMLRSREFTTLVVVGIVTLLPFASLPLNVGFSPTFLNLALGVLFLIWALRIATHRQEPWVASPLSPAVGVFLLLTMAAFVTGLSHASLTPTALRKFAEIPLGIALFFAILNGVRTPNGLRQVTLWLILGGTLAATVGILLYFMPQTLSVRLLSLLRVVRYPSGEGVLRFVDDDPSGTMRAISTSVDPNVLGAVLALTIGLTAPHLIGGGQPLMARRWLALSVGISGICLILTYSRSSLVGLAAGLAVLGCFRGYRRTLAIMLVCGALLLVLPQTRQYVERFTQGVQGVTEGAYKADLATQMRFGEYKDAFILIGRYPWLGVGFVDTPDIDLYLGVSSMYLLIAEEMGLIGLAAYLLCMLVFFATMHFAYRRLPPGAGLTPYILGPTVAVLGGLVGAVLDHTLFSFSHCLTLFWLIIALGAVAAHLSKDSVTVRSEAA
jgi:polysaccharide biosynthesis protein PslJ